MKERIEDGRVEVRQVRQKYMKEIEQAQKDGYQRMGQIG